MRDDLRLALGERAGLVDDERVDLLHALQRLGVLDQDAGLGATPDADHDRHRRGEAERAGAGDDEHGDGGDEAVGEARLRARTSPRRRRRAAATAMTSRHEPAGDLIGQALDRRAAALGLGDHLHDLRQHRVAADLLGSHHEARRVWFIVPPITFAPLLFVTGIDSPVTIDSSTDDSAFDDLAVDRHFLARPHAQTIADCDWSSGTSSSLPSAVSAAPSWARGRAARGSRPRSARAPAAPAPGRAGPDRDDRGGLEIDGDRAVVAAEAAGKTPGASVATTL